MWKETCKQRNYQHHQRKKENIVSFHFTCAYNICHPVSKVIISWWFYVEKKYVDNMDKMMIQFYCDFVSHNIMHMNHNSKSRARCWCDEDDDSLFITGTEIIKRCVFWVIFWSRQFYSQLRWSIHLPSVLEIKVLIHSMKRKRSK